MANTLYDSLFTNSRCEDCCYGEYDSDRDQYYCRHSCVSYKWHDPDDDAPCTYYDEK